MKVQWQVSARQITFGTIQNLVVFPYYFIYYENFVNVILLFSTKTRASYKLEQKSSICVPSFESVGSYRDLHQTNYAAIMPVNFSRFHSLMGSGATNENKLDFLGMCPR